MIKTMAYQVRRVGRFAERLISWLPILWKNEDWDYSTLLYQIQHQVKRFARVQDQNRTGAHWSKNVLECDEFRYLVELVHEDPDDEWSYHYYQYHQSKDINARCAQSDAMCKKVLNLSHKREERNWHNVWSYLDKHLRKWWD